MSFCPRFSAVVGGCVLSLGTAAMAVPSLQLDIGGGTYDAVSETIVASSNPFTLYALAKGDAATFDFSRDYYISASIFPPPDSSGENLGSFTFAGTTVNATADMVFGTPPLEANLDFDAHDLSKHGVFPTFFKEFEFNFVSSQVSDEYNTEDDAGDGPLIHPGAGLFYFSFIVDVSTLDAGSIVHFDLYNTKAKSGDVDRDDFAPFSHDAESGASEGPGTPPDPNPVPEPLTTALAGLALLGLGFSATRRAR